MAETSGTTDRSVIERLLAEPHAFTFGQAVRLLERYARPRARVGFQGPPGREALRFRAHPALDFPASELSELIEQENPFGDPVNRYQVTACFLGLYGSASPLPSTYSESIVRGDLEHDTEDRERLRSYLDIFHHRLFSLFYRCLSKYRYHLLYELGGVDRFSRFMMCMIGRGTAGMPTDRPIPPVKMLRYAGLLVQLPKSAAGLRGIVADYFRPTPVRVDQCRGRWLIVEDRNELGRLHTTLGEDAILGGRVFDRSGKIRLSLGPVDLESFMAFLPIGRAMERLKDLTRSYLLDELEFDVEIWLQGDQVPSIRLGSADPPALLGWTTWLVEGPGEDRSVVFDPDSAAAAARRERMLRDAQRAA